jgi:protein-S-isoprenylcysteine O-methyltransferase Ste14
VITTGPYRFVRHPGYTAALVAAMTSGIALGSWISTFIAPVALVLLRGQRGADARDLIEPLAHLIGSVPGQDQAIEIQDLGLQRP